MGVEWGNSDLHKIWDALQNGDTPSAIENLAQALLPTNSLVSYETFWDDAILGTKEAQLDQWITDNPNYIIRQDSDVVKGDGTGTPGIRVRYTGLKVMEG